MLFQAAWEIQNPPPQLRGFALRVWVAPEKAEYAVKPIKISKKSECG
jgi:hypothetical protein